jgi:GTP:adenosylcobinamide-phosphate guanylyltransferase
MMNVEYIVIQAGGNGTRLEQLTRNKPKALVVYDNLPIMFHLFRRFPHKKFIIIVDYLHDALEKYLEAYAGVCFLTVRARKKGNCAGISEALTIVPDGEPFMIIWSDLILGPNIALDGIEEADSIGIAKDFECRWSFTNNIFEEKPSAVAGVAGVFIFQDKKTLSNIPQSGEFVEFIAEQDIQFRALSLSGSREIGTLADMDEQKYRCRPFNRLEISDDTVIKIPLDGQGRKLAVREEAWYAEAARLGFKNIPEIIATEPLTMRRAGGCPVFRAELNDIDKRLLIDNITASLENLHRLKNAPRDIFSIKEAYYTKTFERLKKMRDLIPFANRKTIVINGKPCRNVYFYRNEVRALTEKLLYDTRFSFIHGDPTFSNIMVDKSSNITFLDPRGYFGFGALYGDVAYDWAKLFYSINGNYDQFNNGNFILAIDKEDVKLTIAEGGWKHLSDYFLAKIPGCSPEKIKFIHAIIWLSLTSYAWEDYDSICGAFYNGVFLMDEFLQEPVR